MKNEYCRNYTQKIDGSSIERVDQYIYLGQNIRMDNDISMEIQRRKRAAWGAFNKIRSTITDQNIDMKIRTHLFNSHILPALTYGSETWNTTKREEQSLKVTQHAIERRICNISKLHHVRNSVIRDRTEVRDVIVEIYTSKRRWAGHVARFKDDRWTYRVTNWYPRGVCREPGRPPMRWENPIVKVMGETWKRKAQDREYWKSCDLHQWRDFR